MSVYEPVDRFVQGAEKSYLELRALKETIAWWTTDLIDWFTEKYNEVARLFGKEVAQKEVTSEVLEKENDYFLDTVFTYDIAKWVSVIVGILVLSIYFNIISYSFSN